MNSGGPQATITSFRNRTQLYHEGKGPDKFYSSYLWRGIESHDDARTPENFENHDDARTVERQRCLCFLLYSFIYMFFSVFFDLVFYVFFLPGSGVPFLIKCFLVVRPFPCFSFQKEVFPRRKKIFVLACLIGLVWWTNVRCLSLDIWCICVLQIWGFPKMGNSPKTRVSMIKN